ncbi:hypothetical protein CC2G_012662 [Coprinopsis cinerea AmutBmut pab1-1]|nr:hypothetical protein CC2G_012662 [Coprinopsis cinerea AmutBmut pab1-1]
MVIRVFNRDMFVFWDEVVDNALCEGGDEAPRGDTKVRNGVFPQDEPRTNGTLLEQLFESCIGEEVRQDGEAKTGVGG